MVIVTIIRRQKKWEEHFLLLGKDGNWAQSTSLHVGKKKTKWKRDTSDPHNKFTPGTTRIVDFLCTLSTLYIS